MCSFCSTLFVIPDKNCHLEAADKRQLWSQGPIRAIQNVSCMEQGEEWPSPKKRNPRKAGSEKNALYFHHKISTGSGLSRGQSQELSPWKIPQRQPHGRTGAVCRPAQPWGVHPSGGKPRIPARGCCCWGLPTQPWEQLPW